MNAPGDSALIFTLLAVFLACTGYAAGRLHQRWQAAQDREEAYRDGYENGTRNVFSTAVRMLGPKRSARGAAAVRPVIPVQPEAPRTAEPVEPAEPVKPTEPVKEPKLGFPAPAPPPPYAITEPAALGGVVFRQFPDPRLPDGAGPLMGERPTNRALPRPRPADRTAPAPDELAAEPDEESSAPAAETPKTRRRRGGHRARRPEEDTTVDQSATETDVPSGRHTVPDELVRATTYRLPPDRIFRARVRDSTPLPEEPTTRLPKPAGPED
nr:hypothetical protein [uncultured Actinoplanes sp.]